MKRRSLLPILLCLLSLQLSAQQNVGNDAKDTKLETPAFLSEEELPNPLRFIPAPPEPGSGPFDNDTYYYHFGKKERQTVRGEKAAIDEEIFKLAEGAQKDANATNRRAKNHYRRTRPFVYFNEPSLLPEYDEEVKESFSYPSGHSVRGWTYALTLALVVPDSTEALIARAQEYAIHRVICGRHYKSDIDASLVEATAVMSKLLSNEDFLEQLEKARKEYASLRREK